MTSENVADWLGTPDEVPVTVIVYVPGAAVDEALIVSVLKNEGLPDAWLNEGVAPDGRLETERATACVVPEARVTDTVSVAELP